MKKSFSTNFPALNELHLKELWLDCSLPCNFLSCSQNETYLCRRFTHFITKYNLMSKDNLIVPIVEVGGGVVANPVETSQTGGTGESEAWTNTPYHRITNFINHVFNLWPTRERTTGRRVSYSRWPGYSLYLYICYYQQKNKSLFHRNSPFFFFY